MPFNFFESFDVWLYIVGFTSVFFIGMGKGGFGGGMAMFGTILLSYQTSLKQAIGVTLPVLCMIDLCTLIAYRKIKPDMRNIRLLIPGMLAGILIGALMIGKVNANYLKFFLGMITMLFVLHSVVRFIRFRGTKPFRHNIFKAYFFSVFGGFTSTVANAGGPPIDFYVLPQRLPQRTYVITVVYLFAMANYLKLIPFIGFGLIDTANLTLSLIFLPAAPLGIYIGMMVNKKVNMTVFYRICATGLFLIGLRLIYDSGIFY